MNYDITFCEGENCARREECHRYRELFRYRADKDPNKKTYILMCKPDPNKCTVFWGESSTQSLCSTKKGGNEQ